VSIKRFLLAAVAAVGLATGAAAAAEEPSLDLEVVESQVRVGDRVEVTASARGGEGLLWGELTVALEPDGPWALVAPPTAIAGVRPPAWKLALAPMALGEQALPEITVSVRSSDGETDRISCAEPPAVTVVSVLSPDEGDKTPAPIRDPIGVRGLPWEWILPACCVLLPLLGGIAWWLRGRGRTENAARRLLPPMEELEALVADLDGRVGRDPADGICDRLAAGLRRFLERRTGEPAEEMTSFELRLLARRRGWPETTQRLIQQVMGVADGVRFSRRPSTEDELRRAIGLALEAATTIETFMNPAEDKAAATGGGR
jgi:hypothetical protein